MLVGSYQVALELASSQRGRDRGGALTRPVDHDGMDESARRYRTCSTYRSRLRETGRGRELQALVADGAVIAVQVDDEVGVARGIVDVEPRGTQLGDDQVGDRLSGGEVQVGGQRLR